MHAITAEPGEAFSAAAQATLRMGVTAQLNHLKTEQYAEQLAEQTTHCESKYFTAVRNAHAALSSSKQQKVREVMQNEWKEDKRFMEERSTYQPY